MNKQSNSTCFVLIIWAASPRVSKFSFMGFGNSLRRVYGANMVCALTPRKKNVDESDMRPQISKDFILPVATSNTFWGTLKCSGFSNYHQNYDNFSIFCFMSRNTRFTDMKPWGQKVLKIPKAPFPSLKINFWVVYNMLWSLRYLQIIEKKKGIITWQGDIQYPSPWG